MMLVDLFAILPFYVVSMGVDLRSIRILRIFRLFRILKLGKYSKSAQIMFQVFKAKKEDLAITILMGLILIFVASFLVYLAEHDAQPENFYGLTSAIWWALATLTPGPAAYDFVNPQTILGKIAGGIIQILSIGIIALPTGILGAGFNEEMAKLKKAKQKALQRKRNSRTF